MVQFLLSLLLTIVVEFIILWIFIRRKPLKILFYEVLINCFTLPIATYVYQNFLTNYLIIESSVVLVESILIMVLFEVKYHQAVLYSFIANATTALLALILFYG